MSHHLNIVRIKSVYSALDDLKDSVVFVGGATVSIYADRPDQVDVRPTEDIDVLIEIGTYAEYAKVQEKLASLHFNLDAESRVICRYKYQGLTVDIMPTEETVLGFKNRWYKEGFANIIRYPVDERTEVNIFSAPYFLASKIEAFKGRGNNDGRTSSDFEDIVFVLDNRKEIWSELKNANEEVRKYLKNEFTKLLANPYLEEWLSAHLEFETASSRARFIASAVKDFNESQ